MRFWSTITGTTPQEEQDAQLAAKKAAFDAAIERRQQAGTITQDRVDDLRAYESGLVLEDTDAAAREGFMEGLQEGRDNIDRGVFGFLGGFLQSVPRFLWVALLVWAFLQFGGVKLLKGVLKKR